MTDKTVTELVDTNGDPIDHAWITEVAAEMQDLSNHSGDQLVGKVLASLLATLTRQAAEIEALREALLQLKGKALLGGDCLGNSGPKFEPCQRSFYMLANIAGDALTGGGPTDE